MGWKDKLTPVSGATATATAPSGGSGGGYLSKLKPVEGGDTSTATVEAPKKSAFDQFLGGAQGVSDFFGGKGITDLIGTVAAKATVPEEQKQYVSDGPTDKEVVGSALQLGSLFAPVGEASNAIKGLLKGAKILPKLAPIGAKTADVVGKVVAGGSAGAAYDVGAGMQGEDTHGLGTIIGAGVPLVPPALKGLSKFLPKGATQTAEEVAGRVVQGTTKGAKVAAEALGNLDTKGVKTYEDLSARIGKSVEQKVGLVDQEFAKSPDPVKLRALDNVIESGNIKGKINYVREALSQLENLYKTTKDLPKRIELQALKQKAVKVGLTPSEINQLAKNYGSEFKAKGFSKVGEALTNISDQAYENTRKGLKEVARSFLTTEKARKLDMEVSKLLTTDKMVKKMVEKVSALEQRVKPRGGLESAGRVLGQGVDLMTMGGVRGFISKFFPSQVGLKTMNSIDLEKELAKNLELLDKLLKMPKEDLLKTLEKIIGKQKKSPLPGDVILRELLDAVPIPNSKD